MPRSLSSSGSRDRGAHRRRRRDSASREGRRESRSPGGDAPPEYHPSHDEELKRQIADFLDEHSLDHQATTALKGSKAEVVKRVLRSCKNINGAEVRDESRLFMVCLRDAERAVLAEPRMRAEVEDFVFRNKLDSRCEDALLSLSPWQVQHVMRQGDTRGTRNPSGAVMGRVGAVKRATPQQLAQMQQAAPDPRRALSRDRGRDRRDRDRDYSRERDRDRDRARDRDRDRDRSRSRDRDRDRRGSGYPAVPMMPSWPMMPFPFPFAAPTGGGGSSSSAAGGGYGAGYGGFPFPFPAPGYDWSAMQRGMAGWGGAESDRERRRRRSSSPPRSPPAPPLRITDREPDRRSVERGRGRDHGHESDRGSARVPDRGYGDGKASADRGRDRAHDDGRGRDRRASADYYRERDRGSPDQYDRRQRGRRSERVI